MATDIKHTQLTRVGYTYQDYVCIAKLLEWYKQPSKYQWFKIEASDTDDGSLGGLDDVVALDKMGMYEFYQVKFTTDSDDEKNKLDFAWLLKHKPKGTSLIQKWSSDVANYTSISKLSIAALKT
ncbi:MAG: hypothetical protein V7727_17650, partial [Sneathiella sp.]